MLAAVDGVVNAAACYAWAPRCSRYLRFMNLKEINYTLNQFKPQKMSVFLKSRFSQEKSMSGFRKWMQSRPLNADLIDRQSCSHYEFLMFFANPELVGGFHPLKKNNLMFQSSEIRQKPFETTRVIITKRLFFEHSGSLKSQSEARLPRYCFSKIPLKKVSVDGWFFTINPWCRCTKTQPAAEANPVVHSSLITVCIFTSIATSKLSRSIANSPNRWN